MTPLLLALAVTWPADLTAVGTVVGPRPERCVAILRSGGRTRVVAVGDSAFGARVAAIGAGSVTLEQDGERRALRVQTAPEAVATGQPPPPLLDAARPAQEMARQEVERRLGQEMPRILAETTMVPAFSEGRVAGMTLTRLPEGSLLTDAGLHAGDVLTSINGVPIDGMATLVGLYARLQGESTLNAVVLRNGEPVSITVTLR
jgi:type II secretion system protein C